MVETPKDYIHRIRDRALKKNDWLKSNLDNAIQMLANDLYSKDTHFIFELIQNAEDNAYVEGTQPSMVFRLLQTDPTHTPGSTGALIIQNNEVGFSAENVDAICSVGKSTKKKAQGYIGEKGIGFKSVFRITTMPHIFSKGYQFRLPEKDEETGLGYIVPQWVENVPDEVEQRQTTIILPLDKKDVGYEKVKAMLRDIRPESILFLSKLKEVTIDTGTKLDILKDDSKLPRVDMLINDEDENPADHVDKFILYERDFQKPDDIQHEKRENITERKVSIVFRYNADEVRGEGLFAYLPVRADAGLPFLINADFILTSSREDVHWDLPWNQWLVRCVAEMMSDFLAILKEHDQLSVKWLDALAGKLEDISEEHEFRPISDAIAKALREKPLLPTDDVDYVSANEGMLVRGGNLRKLLGESQRRLLFPHAPKWFSQEITQDKTPSLYSFLTDDLDVDEIMPGGFARKISADFLKQQSDEWMASFYHFLNNQRALWKKGSGKLHDPDGPLRNKPFIRLQDGSHVPPFSQDDSPNVYLPPEGETDFPIVKRVICENKEALAFLRNLDLGEPDAVAKVKESIIPKYAGNHPQVLDDEHKSDMEKILRAFSTNSRAKKDQLIEILKEMAFIRARNFVSGEIEYKKPEQLYFENEDLRMYFEGNENAWFISLEYENRFYGLFKEIGISDTVRVQKRLASGDGHVIIKEEAYVEHIRGLNGFDPDIIVDGLGFALKNPKVDKSQFIWFKIVVPNAVHIRGIKETSTNKDYKKRKKLELRSEKFGRLLMELPWLPDKQGDFHRPSELKLDDLPESFDCNEKLADQLGIKKNEAAKLAELYGVAPDDIELIKSPEFKEWKASRASKQQPPEFPSRVSSNTDHRKKRTEEQINKASQKEYDPHTVNKRTSRETIDPKTFLRNTYTNEDGQMVCQICENEMPFKKYNGEYYFEEREILSRDVLHKEHEAQHLALCPLCAAKYKYFILNPKNEKEQQKLLVSLKETESDSIPISLGEDDVTVRFVETHLTDLKVILETLDKLPDDE